MRGMWTEGKTQFLVDNYATMDARDIADELGFTVTQVISKAKKLQLRKSAESIVAVRSSMWGSWMNPLERAIRFVDKYQRTIPTTKQVMDDFNVSRATASRYIRTLKDARGLP